MASGVKLTIEEFVKRLSNINKNIEVIDDSYKNMKTPIRVKCSICKNEWLAKPLHLLRGHGCKECYKKRNKLSQEEFLKRINDNIIILNEYSGYDGIINCKCKICNNEWNTIAQNLIYKHGCPACGINKLSKDEFLIRLEKSNNDLQLEGEYINLTTPVNFKCLKCNNIYKTTPNNALKHGCRICYNKNRSMSIGDFIYKLNKSNNNISYIKGFKNCHSHVCVKCIKCGYEWRTVAGNLLGYTGCPNCKKSHGEEKIKTYLECNMIEYEWQKRFDDLYGYCNKHLSYDFYIPTYNLLIEYNGKQHYKSVDFLVEKKNLK